MSKDLVTSEGYNPGRGQFLVYESHRTARSKSMCA